MSSIPTWAKLGLAGAGLAGGAAITSTSGDRADQSGSHDLENAAIAGLAGGVVGASIIPMKNGLGKIGELAGEAVHKKYQTLKSPGGMANALDKASDSILSTAGRVTSVGAGLAAAPIGVTKSIAGNLLKDVDPSEGSLFNIKFNKKGKALMAGIALFSAVSEGNDTYNEIRKGASTGRVLGPTPSFMEEQRQVERNNSVRMAEEYGAGGDLIFALNRNR